jgi:hypothetical protein
MLLIEKIHLKRDYSDWSVLEGIVPPLDYEQHLFLGRLTPERAETVFLERYRELALKFADKLAPNLNF